MTPVILFEGYITADLSLVQKLSNINSHNSGNKYYWKATHSWFVFLDYKVIIRITALAKRVSELKFLIMHLCLFMRTEDRFLTKYIRKEVELPLNKNFQLTSFEQEFFHCFSVDQGLLHWNMHSETHSPMPQPLINIFISQTFLREPMKATC